MRPTITALLAAALLALTPAAAGAWPTWGNIDTNDCAFAAAANWELFHGGTNATEESILAEWRTLDPREEGVRPNDFARFWRTHGIGGHKAVLHNVLVSSLARQLHRHGPVIAEFAVGPGQAWERLAGTPTPGGTATHVVYGGGIHWLVVRSVNRRGPVILTWGQLAQMTWWQWRVDAQLLYVPSAA